MLSEVADSARLEVLRALRRKLCLAIDEAEIKDLPGLARQLVSVVNELDSAAAEGNRLVDDLSAKRARRAASSAK